MRFFKLAEYAYFKQTEQTITLKNLSCWKYSFQKLTQFSQGNNLLDATRSNTGGFLLKYIFPQLS
jgi:hypothetical protein